MVIFAFDLHPGSNMQNYLKIMLLVHILLITQNIVYDNMQWNFHFFPDGFGQEIFHFLQKTP